MKKIISITLVFSIVFLASCSANVNKGNTVENKNADGGSFFSNLLENGISGIFEKELVEIKGIDENVFQIAYSDYKEDTAALMAVAYVPNAEEEKWLLCFLDMKKGEVTNTVDLSKCPVNSNFSGLNYDSDGNIIIVSEENKKRVKYLVDTNTFGDAEDYKAPSEKEIGKKSKFYTNSFSVNNNCIQSTNTIGTKCLNAISFYDEPDAIYINEKEEYYVNSGYAKRIITDYYDKEKERSSVRVYDYETKTVINELIPEPIEGMNTAFSSYNGIFGDAAIVNIEYSNATDDDGPGYDEEPLDMSGEVGSDEAEFDTGEEGYATGDEGGEEQGDFKNVWYIWNYNVNAKNTPFECTRYTVDEITDMNKKSCQEIKKKHGINVHIDKVNKYEDQNDKSFGYKFGTKPFSAFIAIKQINAFFDLLPKGFVKEMYKGFDDSIEGFDIYIVNKIRSKEGYTGYANTSWERYYICFDSSGIDSSVVYHEFMHIIEARIDFEYGYLGYFEELWSKYNPKGFDYVGVGNDEGVDFSKYSDSFATSYSLTTPLEDRADMFMGMVSAGLNEEAPYWFEKDTRLAKKAKFLAKSIRKAFPSMKDTQPQVWEKYLK